MRFTSLAAISLAGFAHARLAGLEPRRPSHQEECCPCPVDGQPDVPVTVTVTEPATTIYAPEKTVTVDKVVSHPVETVYVSEEPETVPTPKPVTKEIPEKEESDVVTKTVRPEPEESPDMPEENPDEEEPEHSAEGPKTVTVHPPQVSPSDPEIVTVTLVPENPTSEPTPQDTREQPKVVTKTLTSKPKPDDQTKTIVEEPAIETADPETKTIVQEPETKTVVDEPAMETHEAETVVLSHEPSIVTVTEGASVTSKTVQIPHTVTVGPNPETIVQTDDHMKTVTETVTDSHGNIDIEIIIININTGDKTCHMKNSGEPCPDVGDEVTVVPTPETTACASVEPSTIIETTFNTVTVTVDEYYPIKPNGTASMGVAHATGSTTPRSRKPRGPQPQQRWW